MLCELYLNFKNTHYADAGRRHNLPIYNNNYNGHHLVPIKYKATYAHGFV